MEVTGYQLKEAIKMKQLELSAVLTQFDESLYKFEDEEKDSPQGIMEQIEKLEYEIAKLQAAQSYYNLQVQFGGTGESLEFIIKRVGGAGRAAKMWRTAAEGRTRDSWDRRNIVTRSKEDEIAKPTISKQDALGLAKSAEQYASRLRSEIAIGNTNTVAIDWVNESLLGL